MKKKKTSTQRTIDIYLALHNNVHVLFHVLQIPQLGSVNNFFLTQLFSRLPCQIPVCDWSQDLIREKNLIPALFQFCPCLLITRQLQKGRLVVRKGHNTKVICQHKFNSGKGLDLLKLQQSFHTLSSLLHFSFLHPPWI